MKIITQINFILVRLIEFVTTKEIYELAGHIFQIHSGIEHLGLIDLEGHVVLDKSSKATVANDPDRDRVLFYYQVSSRRNRREHFDEVYGLSFAQQLKNKDIPEGEELFFFFQTILTENFASTVMRCFFNCRI